MDQETLFKLMANFDASTIRELVVDLEGVHVYLSKNHTSTQIGREQPVGPTMPTSDVLAEATAPDSTATSEKKAAEAPAPEVPEAVIKAQLVGVVYLQPAPGKSNYVHVGDHIEKGQTICVIEAMKMLTEVKSDYTGTIVSIDVNNEEMVDYDQPLMTIQTD